MATLPAPKVEIRKLIEEGKTPLITEETSLEDLLKITDHRVELLWDKVNAPTNNPRMMLLEEKKVLPYHTVYVHKEQDGTIVYVGEGIFGRDGDCLSRRHHTHSRWMLEQVMSSTVFEHTVATGLTKAESSTLEKQLINRHKPRFNKKGSHNG